MRRFGDMDVVIAHMGMTYEMPANHPFIIEIPTEGISHAAMNSAETYSMVHGSTQTRAFLRGKAPHRPAWRDDIECLEPVHIGKALQTCDGLRLAALLKQGGIKFMDDLFRFVAFPATLEE